MAQSKDSINICFTELEYDIMIKIGTHYGYISIFEKEPGEDQKPELKLLSSAFTSVKYALFLNRESFRGKLFRATKDNFIGFELLPNIQAILNAPITGEVPQIQYKIQEPGFQLRIIPEFMTYIRDNSGIQFRNGQKVKLFAGGTGESGRAEIRGQEIHIFTNEYQWSGIFNLTVKTEQIEQIATALMDSYLRKIGPKLMNEIKEQRSMNEKFTSDRVGELYMSKNFWNWLKFHEYPFPMKIRIFASESERIQRNESGLDIHLSDRFRGKSGILNLGLTNEEYLEFFQEFEALVSEYEKGYLSVPIKLDVLFPHISIYENPNLFGFTEFCTENGYRISITTEHESVNVQEKKININLQYHALIIRDQNPMNREFVKVLPEIKYAIYQFNAAVRTMSGGMTETNHRDLRDRIMNERARIIHESGNRN